MRGEIAFLVTIVSSATNRIQHRVAIPVLNECKNYLMFNTVYEYPKVVNENYRMGFPKPKRK